MKRQLIYSLIFCSINLACNDSSLDTSGSCSEEKNDLSWALIPFVKIDTVNPVMGPRNFSFECPVSKTRVFWEAKDVFNPAIAVKEGKLFMLYRAQDKKGTSRIGLAESLDGLHFTRRETPVLFPDHDAEEKYEWDGGCEDPRVVEDSSGKYYMTYTAYDGTLARLMVATSTDLSHWTKCGPAFAKSYNGKSTENTGCIGETKIYGLQLLMIWSLGLRSKRKQKTSLQSN
jgi:hypothetical protein